MPPKIEVKPAKHEVPSVLIRRAEHELPSVWHETFVTLREHELRQAWMGEHPGRDRAEFDHWRATEPEAFKTWSEPHVVELLRARERTIADRLETLKVAYAEALNPGVATPYVFPERGANDLFLRLRGGDEIRPNVGDPGTQVMVAEIRGSAGDLGGFTERLTDIAEKALTEAYVAGLHLKAGADETIPRMEAAAQFEHEVKDRFDAVRDALKKWDEAIAARAEPKAAELEKLARELQQKIEVCRDKLPLYGLDHINKVQAMWVSVPTALYALSAEVARQWQARAGEPSFTGMAFRLSERPAGEKIASGVEAQIKASGGDYRTLWANRRDALLKKLDRSTRNALKKELQTHDLGPKLDQWKKQADGLSEGKYSVKAMQESINGVAYATGQYLASIEKLVTDKAVLQEFRDVLNGLQLQLRSEVALYRQWVTPPPIGAGA